jgi:hypothetical protein
MTNLLKIKDKLMWFLYYGYKPLFYKDEDGSYSLKEKMLMFANLTYMRNIGEYWNINKVKGNIEYDSNIISAIIFNTLNIDRPCMIARYGSIEQTVIANYISIKSSKHNIFDIITGRSSYYWWDKKIKNELKTNAGFFPNTRQYIERYCELMIEDTKMLDVLAIWYGKEPIIIGTNNTIQLIGLQEAEPWWQTSPWTRYLKGKKVVVVHPFAELIEKQYKNRQHLFKNEDILPEFELRTVKAVQSINGDCRDFSNWFDALEWMKREMDKEDYDVALIGCGAYGFCLAAHAKRMGKKAIHMGGVLQLLFGIIGKRWENKQYHPIFNYTKLFNDYWVRPDNSYRPQTADNIEEGCYW